MVGEEDAEFAVSRRVAKGQADIAIREPQALIISQDHDGPPVVVRCARIHEAVFREDPLHQTIKRFDAIGAAAYGAENAELIQSRQRRARLRR